MTTTTTSGTPVPQGTDAFNPNVQLLALANNENLYNWTVNVADAAARNALASPTLRSGLLASQVSDGSIHRYDGSTWKEVFLPDTGDLTLTLNSGWVGPLTYRRRSGHVTLNGRLTATTGAGATLGTLPSGFRPSVERLVMVYDGTAGWLVVLVQVSGDIVQFGKGAVAYTDFRMAGVPAFPVA